MQQNTASDDLLEFFYKQFYGLIISSVIRLVRDELRLPWKADESRRRQKGAVTKSCSEERQQASQPVQESRRNTHISLDPIPI